MSWVAVLALLLGLLLGLMGLGLPVAFAFFGVNLVGAYLFLGGEAGLDQLARNAIASVTSYTLSPIPLFILMGELLFRTGLAVRAINAVDRVIRRLPGRLAVVSVAGGTIFSSLSGSTVANTAMLGSILLPDMLRRGYHPTIAMGPIMATGGIAMLIPPSALAVLLGSLANVSISKLLIAGIVPGLMMAALFFAYIVLRCRFNPALAPAGDAQPLRGWDRWGPFVKNVLPLMSLFVVVVGSIVAGWATPTESAALGSVAAFIAAIAYRALTWRSLVESLMETVKLSVMILLIVAASTTFAQILAFSGGTDGLLRAVTSYQPDMMTVLLVMLIVLLILGAFMDQVSMIMITLPFFLPLAAGLQIDLLWLSVLILIVMEISFTTPPFGLLLFVMKGVAPPTIRMMDIYRAAMPFIGLELLVLVALVAFPALATWLPGQIGR